MSRRRNGWAPATGADPREDAATTPVFDFQLTEDTSTQLRRHRTASRRCEPLEDGHLDPLEVSDCRDRWSSAWTLHLEVGRRTAWLYGGQVRQLIDRACRRAGTEPRTQRDHRRRVWRIPVDRADDLLSRHHRQGRAPRRWSS
jgi:hypothetical protein